MFGFAGAVDEKATPPVAPDALVTALAGSSLAEDATKFLTIIAVMDSPIDDAKLDMVLNYAAALGIHQRYIEKSLKPRSSGCRKHLPI